MRGVFPALLTLTAAATACALLSTFHWFLELFSHFTPYYLAAALALAAGFFALGRRRYASAARAGDRRRSPAFSERDAAATAGASGVRQDADGVSLQRRISPQDGAAVVVGDFNLTPYSPYFRRFAEAAGLQPARSGLFSAPTWPAPLAQMWIGIPIDHGFVSRNGKIISHEIGPDLGSDHLPVILTVVF